MLFAAVPVSLCVPGNTSKAFPSYSDSSFIIMIFTLFTFLLSVRSGKVKALMREAAQLKSNLPIHPNASILVRQVSVLVL